MWSQMDCCYILFISIWLFLMYSCWKFNSDDLERCFTGVILIFFLGCIFFMASNLSDGTPSHNSVIHLLMSALPACMLFILKITVKKDIELCKIFLSFIVFTGIAIASNQYSIFSVAFTSMAIGNGIWLLERFIRACVRRVIKCIKCSK